ncbi:hypothetical protein N7508_006094 [Penicillium antarcticum]|uniref:uncharacterized protein n=1 Tax=Penicillium antarcticum TaxID=416450 RepID=UPI00239DA565|nr:uncharacterized protein N7508_006094 [Penicillium antarcticum]KAJ5307079.1 hypothetical protein N7508_006094 [Penicillium antarcticum]
MPSLLRRPSSLASTSSEESDWLNEHAIVSDKEYNAIYFDGYAEKPISEQLEPIAVVGMGCRLPGNVSSPAQFWDMMINKRTGRTAKVPASRFNIDAHLHPNNERPGSFNVPGGYFLDSSLQEFDPVVFNISPVEAMWMDPQQRKLLEVVYEAFESGGVSLNQIENTKTGVFVGSFTSDFQQMSFKEPDFRHSYAATGVDPGIISNRISHVFNISGPSMTVNTACSSSVYAMHNACNALRNNECNGAVVGGTNLILTVDQHMNTAKLGVLSPDSTCHTFDASANGYGRAEGVGAVYLKRLSDAVRDGDPIRGVLRSSAVNNNGKVPGVGITHPNLEGQAQVIRDAYERGGDLDPRLTGYFECHGTGTAIGDPLEVHAVSQAMNKKGPQGMDSTLLIGAVKTNIGHSEAASGLSAIIKAVLTVEAGIIPPTRGVENPNPNIDWENWHVKVPSVPQPFPTHLPVRRVSVNSFGYGGTNGHFIVEGADSLVPGYSHGRKRTKPTERGVFHQKRPYLLPFSAHDKPTLMRNIEAYAKVLDDYNIVDLSYTLANRRSKLASRGFVVTCPNETTKAFGEVAQSFVFADKKKTPTLGFVFTGQGAQWARMGCELMLYYPSFLRTIRKLDQVLGDLSNGPEWTLEDVLHEDSSESRINEAEFSQPLCTAIQMALVDLLDSWGVKPAVTVGHSSGEIAAAYAAGLVGFNEAIIAAYFRGKTVKDIDTDGAMMAVGLGAEAVQPYLSGYEGQVVVACHNSPALVTLSGDAAAIGAVKGKLDADSVFARVVKTGGKAYHSFHVKPASAVYHKLMHEAASEVEAGSRKSTRAVMVSSVTNTPLDPTQPLNADYWCANLMSPVKLNQAVHTIGSDAQYKVDVLVEIGPHSALKGPINQICRTEKFDKIDYLPTMQRGGNSAIQLLNLAAALVVPDDDDGIETLFALQLSVYSDDAGRAWWDFNVSSCSRDGHWNSHMTGTVGVNPCAARQPPRHVPTFTQRATGKAWNQALKTVGFDYGPSFQDMQSIRTDGKSYQAAASSVVKRSSGIVEGESRYVLHPACMDSCLQLIIVSIYAGRIQDMTCGAVPIQVDEVSVWQPSQTQEEKCDAQAYAWTDERGFRSFVSGTQLVGSDGQLLLSIKGMRCVSYEAAVPQSRGSEIKEQPFMQMTWDIDIDTLTESSPIKDLSTSDLVALAAFKKPGLKVLDLAAQDPVSICKTSDLINYTATTATDAQVDVLKQAISGYQRASVLKVDPAMELEQQGLKGNEFDLVLLGTPTEGSKLEWLLAPGGRVIGDSDKCLSLNERFQVMRLMNGVAIATPKQAQNGAALSNGNGATGDSTITIVYRDNVTDIPGELLQALKPLGSCRLVALADAQIAPGKHVVVTCDLEGPFLSTLQENELSRLQESLSNASSVLWVTVGGLINGTMPEQAMASGLARSVTSEMASLDLTTLDLDLSNTSLNCAVHEIVRAVERQITHADGKESEYCVANDLVHISRVVANDTLNHHYGPQSSIVQSVPFKQSDKLVGMPQASKLVFTHDVRADQTVGPDEVQVRVALSDLNKEDVFVRNGTDPLTTFSHEIYGEVTQKGSNVKELEVGDYVVGFSHDRLASFQTVHAGMVQKANAGDVPEELVTLPMAYATALHGLDTLSKVELNEVVLILHGSGNFGAAAIALSKHMGARTYVAVPTSTEAATVAALFGLPLDNIIFDVDNNLMSTLKQRTGGVAADVVFSSAYISPTVAHECWRDIATFGRFIEIGRKNSLKRSALDTVPLARCASYMAFDIIELYHQKPQLLSAYLRQTLSLYRQNAISLVSPIEKRNIAEYDHAVAAFSDDFAAKKTVIEYAESDGLIHVQPRRMQIRFRPDATYFLVGCLGGLGRSLTSWMVQRGARRFAFLSRSGTDKADAADLVRALEGMGVTCQVIRGDVANKENVRAAIQSIPASHPVRGVVHAAMVLRDGLFHSMSHDSWKTSIGPKVTGAINLHEVLANTDLDFFLCTSSTSGILGTPGQANYAAGNSFLDSLCRHRVLRGQPGSSLVLPMVQNVGVVAENPEIEAALRRKGIYGIDETHLLEAIEAAVLTQSSTHPADHLIVGLDPSKLSESLSSNDVTDSFWTEDARFKGIMAAVNANASANHGSAEDTILNAVKRAGSLDEARGMVAEHFTTRLARLLLLESDVFEPDTIPIVDYGLDSMIGAELRNWIFKEYDLNIPFQQLLSPSLTITKFAGVVCENQGLA